MAKRQTQICVIGAGKWGINHVDTLYKMGNLGGIIETDSRRLQDLMEKYPLVKGYPNVDNALSDGYDGYIVATPAGTHFAVGSYLLKQKQHVLIEKPLALSSQDAQALIQAATENKCKLMVGHVLLFHPAIKKIKTIIDSGKIGKLQYIYSNRLNFGTVRTQENVFWSFAPHDISMLDFFIGKAPIEIYASGGVFLQEKIADVTLATLSYPENIKAHIFVSWLHPFKEHRLVIIGDQGMLTFEDSSKAKEILFYDNSITWSHELPVKKEGPTTVIEYEKSLPLENELSYFIDNLDGEIKIADGRSGHEVVKVLELVSARLLNRCNEGEIN